MRRPWGETMHRLLDKEIKCWWKGLSLGDPRSDTGQTDHVQCTCWTQWLTPQKMFCDASCTFLKPNS